MSQMFYEHASQIRTMGLRTVSSQDFSQRYVGRLAQYLIMKN